MKPFEILTETKAELILRKHTTAARLARQFLENANGDVDLAKKMMDGFSHQVKSAIDEEALGTRRRRPSAQGYEQQAGPGRSYGHV